SKPDSDVARANMGVMLLRLGEMALELNGDVRLAREHSQEAYEIQQAIAANPRSHDYTDVDNKRLLAFADMRLGKAALATGDLEAARRHFEEARLSRQFWVDEEPSRVDAKSWLSEAYLWLGVAAGRYGDPERSKANFERCLSIINALVEQFPNDFSFKA